LLATPITIHFVKILAATCDDRSSAVILAAVHLRWPDSGQVIVWPSVDGDTRIDPAGFDLGIVDGGLKYAATQVVARIRESSNLPLLFVADPQGDQMDTAWALQFENVDYLFKPLELAPLISRIETLTESRDAFPDLLTSTQIIQKLKESN